jgi:hypothetical protein
LAASRDQHVEFLGRGLDGLFVAADSTYQSRRRGGRRSADAVSAMGKEALDADEVARIQALDRNYVATASALGLMKEPKESDDENLAAEMEKRGWNKAVTR